MKILNIYNNAPLYREGIFTLIDRNLDSDWVFGEAIEDIKQMDLYKLKGKTTIVKNFSLLGNRAYWQKGVVKQLFNNEYTHYVILGDERCLSTWTFLFLSIFFPKKKIYLWSHGAYGKEGKIKHVLQRVYWSLADGAALYGNYAKAVMNKFGFDTSNYYVIHNSLDYNRQLKLRNSGLSSSVYLEHFGNGNPVLIFIGRLTKVKKLDMLVDAVSLLKQDGNDYNLVFVGNGVESAHLKEKVHKLDLDSQVWFYGACYDERTNAELIYNAEICVAPGNVGLTAMHSLVFGTPVISHNNFAWQMPEFEAIHPGSTGDFFEYQNVNSLKQTIRDWHIRHGGNRDVIRKKCYHEIDTQWNPEFQLKVYKKMLGL